MKKLMITLALAALAISVNARPAVVPPVYGMYEETEGFETYAAEEVLESYTPTVEGGNTYLWYSEYSGAGTVKAYGENDAKLDGAGNNYLNVETTTGTPLYRRVVATDDYWNHPDDFFRAGLYDDIKGGIYIDTYFQFTKKHLEMDILCGENTHLIVWVKANEGSDNGTPNDESDDILPSTNLIVTAANMDANGNPTPKDFVIETAANFDFGAWHQLTIRAIEDITADGKLVVGFVVFVDREQVNAVADEDVYKELMGDYYKNVNLTMEANKFFAAKQLFVGMVSPKDLLYDELIQELTAVGFGGSGKIDNLTLTRTTPAFFADPIPQLSATSTAEQVAAALEGSADAKLAANIKTAAEYAAYRTWALGLEGVTREQVKASPNAWLSYALVTDKLIEGEVAESRLKVTSFKLSGENNLFSIKLKIDDVDVGDAATEENLLKIFAIEGTKELSGDSFLVDNVALEVVQINEGEVEFIVTPREKGRSFFFRARMRDNINGVGMNSFSDSDEKVQLWEGGPYWARANIGAENPVDYGYYFWWGDTIGYKRENDKWVASDGSNSNFSFSSDNTPTYGKINSTLQSEGWITTDGVLAPEHDAAHKHWGGDWRMPTKQEFEDLNSKCDWIWTSRNGVNGYVVRGRGEYAFNSIFLPCAGYGYGTSLINASSDGYYWSSVPGSDYYYAWHLFFISGYHSTIYNSRYYGQSIRPVQGFSK